MLRTTCIGLASVIALGVSLASPATAMGGHMGGGAMGGHVGGTMGGTVGSHMSGNMGGGGAIHGGVTARGSMMAARSDFSAGRFTDHDMGHMRMGGDRDHDRDHHDHDRFHFFPTFAFGVNTYADVYDPDDCWVFQRVRTHAGWRLRRYWACY